MRLQTMRPFINAGMNRNRLYRLQFCRISLKHIRNLRMKRLSLKEYTCSFEKLWNNCRDSSEKE